MVQRLFRPLNNCLQNLQSPVSSRDSATEIAQTIMKAIDVSEVA